MKLPVLSPTLRRSFSPETTWLDRLRSAQRIAVTSIVGLVVIGTFTLLTLRVDDFVRRSTFFDVKKIEIVGAGRSCHGGRMLGRKRSPDA